MKEVILITGASSGFGLAAAQRFAALGYTVFASMRDIAGRNAANCAALNELAARDNLMLHPVELDVRSDASVSGAVSALLAQTGRIDVVINNAGFANIGITEAYPPEQFQQMFETNLFGVARVNRAVLPGMRKQRSGLLIHVSSGAGRLVIPCMGLYCASKFALEALADAYRFELKPFGIDSVLVEPGIFRTAIFQKDLAPADVERVTDYGTAADCAKRVADTFKAALASPETSNGSEVVDAFVRLVEMPTGQRPFRTPVGAVVEPLLAGYNEAAAKLRPNTAERFRVPELV